MTLSTAAMAVPTRLFSIAFDFTSSTRGTANVIVSYACCHSLDFLTRWQFVSISAFVLPFVLL